MRKSFSHKLLLLGFLLLCISGIARTSHAVHASLSCTQETKKQQLGTESNHEIQLTALHHLPAAHHRLQVKHGPGFEGYAANTTLLPADTSVQASYDPTEQVHSRHLLLIFPFHYFW